MVNASRSNTTGSDREEEEKKATTTRKGRVTIALAPGALKFWWQVGCVSYILDNFKIDDALLSGASAGAITATFSACNVDVRDAFGLAERLTIDAGCLEVPLGLGLVGRFKGIVRTWLDELLPNDAHERCSGKVFVLVHGLKNGRKLCSEWDSRGALIETLLSATHIPFLMDLSPFHVNRGPRGAGDDLLSFDAALTMRSSDELQPQKERVGESDAMILIDYKDDEKVLAAQSKGPLSNFRLATAMSDDEDGSTGSCMPKPIVPRASTNPRHREFSETFASMVELGYSYGAQLDSEGKLDALQRRRRRRRRRRGKEGGGRGSSTSRTEKSRRVATTKTVPTMLSSSASSASLTSISECR